MEAAERRKYKRTPTAKPATAASGDWVGRITDVSMGGMAILHRGELWPQEIKKIDLQVANHHFQLPVTVVWDEVVARGEAGVVLRRCGIQFEKLTELETHKLEHFIWSQLDGCPEIPFPDGEPN